MASTQEIVCACGCGRKKQVRTADVKRGWGKYYSKSCKAKKQSKTIGRRSKLTKRKRFERLCEALDDGRISREYYLYTVNNEYSEFADSQDEMEYIETFEADQSWDAHK